MSLTLPVVTNLATATFDCSYGRGCDGICCKNSEPPVTPAEQRLLTEKMPLILPHLRPEARADLERNGFTGELHADGNPKLTLVNQWCVFFNSGCVLHKLGAAAGDAFALKPSACSMFPLEQNAHGEWYVRQWGVNDEEWDLFCLNPANSTRPAAESLGQEVEYVADLIRRDAVPPVLPFLEAAPARESA
jgi:Fe-S-cluster containining protein